MAVTSSPLRRLRWTIAPTIRELKRRRVFRVAGAYVVAAWVIVQAASILFPTFDLPGWSLRLVVALELLGLPVAIMLAWAYDVVPAGTLPAPESGAAAAREQATSLTPAPDRPRVAVGAPRASLRSIAVLPFQCLGADASDDYLGEGIAEEITTALGRVGEIRVASRLAVRAAAQAAPALGSLRDALAVGSVLEGSVRRAGSDLRISARLTDANDGVQLWARTFDGNLRDIFAVQEKIAEAIVLAVHATLVTSPDRRLVPEHTRDVEAYSLYLKGRYHWNRRPRETVKALEYLDAAIARDPGFALAHAGVADAFNALGSWEAAALAPLDAFPRAHAAAVRALELNPQLAEAHTPLAYASMHYLWAWRQAEAQFQRAIALDPRYVHAHHWYSHYLMATRRIDESLAESRRALELEPVDIIINVHLAWHYWLAGQHEEAVEQCARTAELDPRDQWAPFFSGLALAARGDVSPAVEEHRKALELSGGSTVMLAALGHSYAAAGDSAAARAIAERLAREHAPRHVCAYELAVIHAALGERDLAFDWLDRAYVERSAWLPYLAVDPRNEPLRDDARFRTLLHAVGLAQAPTIAVAPPA